MTVAFLEAGGDLRHVADVAMALIWLGFATVGTLRPVEIARWVKQAHPNIDENDERLLSIIRFICVVGLAMGVAFSTVAIRSVGT